jgi:hypothetical protein
MANIQDMYPSAFLKASDLQGRTAKLTVQLCEFRQLGDETKPVLKFKGKDKEMVLNKTNSMAMAAAFGNETNGWSGKTIEVFSMPVQFNGQLVDGLRLRAVQPEAPAAAAPEPMNDDIPF